jgi:hypothetical protein
MSIPSTPIISPTDSTKNKFTHKIPDEYCEEESNIHRHHRNHPNKTVRQGLFLFQMRSQRDKNLQKICDSLVDHSKYRTREIDRQPPCLNQILP